MAQKTGNNERIRLYRIDCERALKERCYKMAIETMRILPHYDWKPITFANDIHAWILGRMREVNNHDGFSCDPYEDLT